MAQVGRVPLLLLDSDIEDNDVGARQVTDRLYGGGEEHRLEQELLLGVGGVRADPGLLRRHRCHARAVRLPHQRGPRRLPGRRAHPRARRGRRGWPSTRRCRPCVPGTVFTTHTPVPAGHRPVPAGSRRRAPGRVGLPCRPSGSSPWGPRPIATKFNMAHMGLRLGQRANGVSLLHGEVSRGMFADLWPGFDTRRGADLVGDQWRARPDVDVARHPRDRRARGRLRPCSPSGGGWEALDKVGDRRAVAASATSCASRAGRRDPPPDPKASARAAGDQRGRARRGRRPPSTPTCSPSASPVVSRPTSG